MNNLDNAAAKAFGWDAERLKGPLHMRVIVYHSEYRKKFIK